MFSCKMVGLRYKLVLVSRPEKDVLYPLFHLNVVGNPQGRGQSFYHLGNAMDWLGKLPLAWRFKSVSRMHHVEVTQTTIVNS